MTHTTTPSEPPADAAAGPNPSHILMDFIVALLAPMFLSVTAGDAGLARGAAIETVNAYRTRNHADLVAIAQVIGFGLAALGSLSLSMADDISLSMTLRLRGSAIALNRAAEHNRRSVRQTHDDNQITPVTYHPPTLGTPMRPGTPESPHGRP